MPEPLEGSQPEATGGHAGDRAAGQQDAQPPLGSRVREALLWNTGFNLFRDAQQFLLMLVLVRLLPPEAYGQYNFAIATIGFAMVFSHQPIVAYILQLRPAEAVPIQQLFTGSGVIQVALFAVVNAIAGGFWWFATTRDVALLVHVTSLLLLLDWPTEIYLKLLERELRFLRFRALHVIGIVSSSLTSVVIALLGGGVWSLVVGPLLTPIPFIVDFFWHTRFRPSWLFCWHDYRPALRFGLSRLVSLLLLRGRPLIETATISSLFGFATLGFYNRATGLGQMVCFKPTFQLMYTIYPAMNHLQPGSAAFRRAAGLVLQLVVWTAVPLAVLFAVLAAPTVAVLYGPRWSEVVVLLPLTLCVLALQAVLHCVNTIILSLRRPDLCAKIDTASFVVFLLALAVGVRFGLLAYLAAYVASQALVVALTITIAANIHALETRQLWSALAPAAIAAAVAVLVCEGVRLAADLRHDAFLSAAAWGIAFGCLYLLTLRTGFAGPLTELVQRLPAQGHFRRLLFLPAH